MDETDRRHRNGLHSHFPLCHAPFEQAGAALGLAKPSPSSASQVRRPQRALTRFGPLPADRAHGRDVRFGRDASARCRLLCGRERVNAHVEVAHNYEREHALKHVVRRRRRIAACGLTPLRERSRRIPVCRCMLFPKECEYFVGMELAHPRRCARHRRPPRRACSCTRCEYGVPTGRDLYATIAERLGTDEAGTSALQRDAGARRDPAHRRGAESLRDRLPWSTDDAWTSMTAGGCVRRARARCPS